MLFAHYAYLCANQTTLTMKITPLIFLVVTMLCSCYWSRQIPASRSLHPNWAKSVPEVAPTLDSMSAANSPFRVVAYSLKTHAYYSLCDFVNSDMAIGYAKAYAVDMSGARRCFVYNRFTGQCLWMDPQIKFLLNGNKKTTGKRKPGTTHSRNGSGYAARDVGFLFPSK